MKMHPFQVWLKFQKLIIYKVGHIDDKVGLQKTTTTNHRYDVLKYVYSFPLGRR